MDRSRQVTDDNLHCKEKIPEAELVRKNHYKKEKSRRERGETKQSFVSTAECKIRYCSNKTQQNKKPQEVRKKWIFARLKI